MTMVGANRFEMAVPNVNVNDRLSFAYTYKIKVYLLLSCLIRC